MSNNLLNKEQYEKTKNKIKLNVIQASKTHQKIKVFIKNILKSIPKRFVRAFIILVLSFLFVTVFLNREKFSPDYVGVFLGDMFMQMQSGEGYPYNINGNKVNNGNFKSINKDIFVLSDTSFVCLNKSAKEMNNKRHRYQNPILKVSDNRSIIYDVGGKYVEINSKSKTLHTAMLDNNIISAAISSHGIYSAVTESNGFLGQLTVYSKDGDNVYYKYNFADHYITDVAISENGRSTAVCGCTAQNGSMVSAIYVFDYKNEKPKVKLEYHDNMMIQIEYLSNGNIVAVGDKLISVINPRNGTSKDYNYENKTLISFDINKNDGILLALSLSEDGNNTDIVLINKSGKVESAFETKNNIKSVNFKYRKIAALSYGNLYIYNLSGNKLKTIEVGNETRKVNLFSSRGAYILGATKIKKIRF